MLFFQQMTQSRVCLQSYQRNLELSSQPHYNSSSNNIKPQYNNKLQRSNNKNSVSNNNKMLQLKNSKTLINKTRKRKMLILIQMLILQKNRSRMETTKQCSHNWMSVDLTSISWQGYLKMCVVRSNRTHNLLPKTRVNLQILIHLLKLNLVLQMYQL